MTPTSPTCAELLPVLTLLHIYRDDAGTCAHCEAAIPWNHGWEIHRPSGLHSDALFCSQECCEKGIANVIETEGVSAQTNSIGREF